MTSDSLGFTNSVNPFYDWNTSVTNPVFMEEYYNQFGKPNEDLNYFNQAHSQKLADHSDLKSNSTTKDVH